VHLRDVWPTQREVDAAIGAGLAPEMFVKSYSRAYEGDEAWRSLEVPGGATYAWDPTSTYVKNPPYFEGLTMEPAPVADLTGARVLAVFGDSITTDHISPAGNIKADSPAGKYLQEHGVKPSDFNSYGARRGNHEVMVRGTFANVRIKNKMVPGTEGGLTVHVPSGERMAIFDAAARYASERTPLVVLAGKEYGSGSSRDWAAKGPALLGVKAVIAESYERIHRSNLVGMGILPLEFPAGKGAEALGLDGTETLSISGLAASFRPGAAPARTVKVTAVKPDGKSLTFDAVSRLDTPREREYFRHGGILPYVARQLLAARG
jgi:aconitate hydratase